MDGGPSESERGAGLKSSWFMLGQASAVSQVFWK